MAPPSSPAPSSTVPTPRANPTWEDFCAAYPPNGTAPVPGHVVRQARGSFADGVLTLATGSTAVYDKLRQHEGALARLATEFCGAPVRLALTPPANGPATEAMLIQAYGQREELKPCMDILEARLERVVPLTDDTH